MTWTVSYTIEDAKGLSSSTEVNFVGTATFADVQRAALRIGQLINGMTRGALRKVNISYSVGLPEGVRVTPLENSDVEEGARFQFRTTNGFFTGMRIPTFDESLLVANSTEVNQSATAVQQFIAAIVNGVALTDPAALVTCVDKRGEDIIALSFAREQFQSSRR